MTCTVDLCEKPRKRRDTLCSMHRSRKLRHGSTDARRGSSGTLAERYERFVDRRQGECWAWTGTTNERGYAQVGRNHAHRLSYQLHVGPIPIGLLVLHRCDNPPCTNPEHLFLGTQADNIADAKSKGRLSGPRGEANSKSKLTGEQVRQIRAMCASGAMYRAVADTFGVTHRTIGEIVRRKTWRHV